MTAEEEYTGFYETEYIYCCENYSECNGRYDNEQEAIECCPVCSECGKSWHECEGVCELCDDCQTDECENSPEGDEPCPEVEEVTA